ncbi:MAG: phosphate ABC transporter substrate-binding protein PstS [Verrucomicrobia bacterium]|nr:phosphate ABC transporter substrate-binding protein PstS [Verrucomicrobiota bacterium]MCF7708382.1 phosphate ABC transporter substrate-binding protein PstS [Verrucomicrobiota bacterium]
MKQTLKPILIGTALIAAIAMGCKPSDSSQGPDTGRESGTILINGAGATFPYPLYSKWFNEYIKVDPSVRFNYQSIGSGGGQNQIIAQTVGFGASDAPMSDESLAKARGNLLHIPTVAGAVVVSYNLEKDIKLKLNGSTVADIFLGKIKKWNDQRIAELNPDVELPDEDILVVHRSDGSGTSYIFTSYLSGVSSDWKQKVGAGKSVRWPTGLGGKGNEGVAGQIKQSPGAIGYVELIYAMHNDLAFADIKNAAGNFISPSAESVTAAMSGADIPDDFRFSIINTAGENAYPISGATWLLVYENQPDPRKGRHIVQFLKWALTDGQDIAPDLDYAPLSTNLRQRVLEKIDQIKY